MKRKLLAFVLALGLISTAVSAEDIIINLSYCEENVTQEGFYPHPQSHEWFYMCVININGEMGTVAFHCPNGLWFDPSLNVCDWPWDEQ